MKRKELSIILIFAGLGIVAVLGGWLIWSRPKVTLTTDKKEYREKETVQIAVKTTGYVANATLSIERYDEKEGKWEETDIGQLEIEEQSKDRVESYGPAASLKGMSARDGLTLSWIPVTREYMFIDEPEKFIEIVASGKHRIKVTLQQRIKVGEERTFYSDDFWIGEQFCEVGKEYEHTATNPVTCQCPEGFVFETVSMGWGPCPQPGMSDCPASVVRCVSE